MQDKIIAGKMKAIRMHSRGGPENLVYEDANIPEISKGEVLIRVHAASITPTELTWNSSFTDRNKKERFPVIPSFEVSGTVSNLSSEVKHLKLGDEVYGLLDFWRNGAAAEYVATDAAEITLKPSTLDHISAASLPLSGLTAWQALFDHGHLKPGQTVLIHGAGGGVGSLAVQIAHWKGAEVIGTCSKRNEAIVRQLGANQVIDYSNARFEDVANGVDLVLDTVGGEVLNRSYQIVRRGGTVVTVADDIDEEIARKYGAIGISFLVEPNRGELREIALLADSGKIRPVIQDTFPLRDAKQAFISGMANHNTGKTVLRVID